MHSLDRLTHHALSDRSRARWAAGWWRGAAVTTLLLLASAPVNAQPPGGPPEVPFVAQRPGDPQAGRDALL